MTYNRNRILTDRTPDGYILDAVLYSKANELSGNAWNQYVGPRIVKDFREEALAGNLNANDMLSALSVVTLIEMGAFDTAAGLLESLKPTFREPTTVEFADRYIAVLNDADDIGG